MTTPVEIFDTDRVAAAAPSDLAGPSAGPAFDDLAQAGAALVEAPLAFVALVDAEGAWLKGTSGFPATAEPSSARTGSFWTEVLASHDALVVHDAHDEPRPARTPEMTASGAVAWAAFPVRDAAGQAVGVFCVADVEARDWTPTQVEALRVLARAAAGQVQLRAALQAERRSRAEAEEAWLAAERSRLDVERARNREHEVVDLIQRSLLPSPLPAVPGLVTAVRFEVSNDAAGIGGDWYDVVHLGDDDVAFVIGDVCGHDLAAVAVMAQVRHYLHVLALREPDPVGVLAGLDRLMLEQDFDRFATVAFLRWRAAESRLTYLSAGHPPALVVRGHGGTELLEDGRRPPVNLGLADEGRAIPGEAVLAEGDVLILFTDGLFECVSPDPDVALGRLRTLAAEVAPRCTPEELADELLAGMRPATGWADDVALVVARRTG